MRPEEIERHLRKRPFVPIRFHLTDGTTHDIVRIEEFAASASS